MAEAKQIQVLLFELSGGFPPQFFIFLAALSGLQDLSLLTRDFFFFFFFCSQKNMERFTNLRVILAQGPC